MEINKATFMHHAKMPAASWRDAPVVTIPVEYVFIFFIFIFVTRSRKKQCRILIEV